MTTPVFTTPTAVEALRPNIYAFPPQDIVPEALIVRASTLAAEIEGDEPIVSCPFIDPGEAGFTPEGEELDENEVDSREVEVATGKVTISAVVSNEMYRWGGVPDLLMNELKRVVIVKADNAFLAQSAPPANRHTPPAGLLN
jgi:hypothetical protein